MICSFFIFIFIFGLGQGGQIFLSVVEISDAPRSFFPAKFFFYILEKEVLAGKKLLCKEGYSISDSTFGTISVPNPI
jgi:hypothetical protein